MAQAKDRANRPATCCARRNRTRDEPACQHLGARLYSRPLLDDNGKKRWEVLICTSDGSFQWQRFCPADSVNSIWLKTALSDALAAAEEAKAQPQTPALLAQLNAHHGAAGR